MFSSILLPEGERKLTSNTREGVSKLKRICDESPVFPFEFALAPLCAVRCMRDAAFSGGVARAVALGRASRWRFRGGDDADLQNAKNLLALGNAREAETAFRALLRLPNADEARAGVALSLLSLGSRSEAKIEVEGATTPLSIGVRALFLIEDGDARGAQALLEPLAGANGAPFQLQTLLALAQLQNGDTRGALLSSNRAINSNAQSAGARATLSLAQFFAGQDDTLALRNARLAVELDPFSPLALLSLGRLEAARGNLDEARQALEQAVALSPELFGAQSDLGAIELALDRLPRAEIAFRAALERRPDDARALAGLGAVLLGRGERAGAKTTLDRAVFLAPDDAFVRANRAAFLVENGDLDEAAREGDALLARQNVPANNASTRSNRIDDPTLGALFIRLSEAALFRQKLDDALRFAREGARLLPGSAPARYQLARVFLEQGRTIQAEQGFQLALVFDPNFASARYAFGLLRGSRGFVGSGRVNGTVAAALEASQARTLSFQDLSSPGTSERVQATTQNPTVFRSASRSFGDTQLDGNFGESGSRFGSLSFARESKNRRGALGLNASNVDEAGVRPFAGWRDEDVVVQAGQKAGSNASGVWALASVQRLRPGFDTGETSDPLSALQRVDIQRPTFLVGGNFGNRSAQTRVLLGADHARVRSTLVENLQINNFKTLHGEVRHDRRLNQNLSLVLGWSLGERRLSDFSDSGPIDTPGGTQRFLLNASSTARAQSGYARAVWTPTSRLRVEAELRGRRLHLDQNATFTSIPPDPGAPTGAQPLARNVTVGLPGLIVLFRPSSSSTLRLRSRRLFGSVEDFDLLAPTDLFLTSLDRENPRLALFGRGRSHELEFSHTFPNASFVRLNAFRFSARGALSLLSGQDFIRSRFQGIEAEFNTLLDSRVSLAVRTRFLDGRGVALDFNGDALPGASFAALPKFDGEIDLQYLARNGFFVQVSQAYVGGRREVLADGETLARRSGGFGLSGARIGKRFGLRATVFLEASNLFDKRYTITSRSLNELQAGRRFRVGASVRF